MRFIKAFGLAAFAALAAMAFLGASSASAEPGEHLIVLCKELVKLCPNGKLWPAGTEILALSEDGELLSSLGTTTECEDSIVTGLSATELGSVKDGLKFDNVVATFGVLPTPKLGLGCTGSCTAKEKETIHVDFEDLRILVETKEEKDFYYLLGKGLAGLLNCPIVGNCAYRNEHVKVPIDHDGKHPAHEGENLPLAKFLVELTRIPTHLNNNYSSFCPAKATWHATYVFTLAHVRDKDGKLIESGLAWPALDKTV